MQFIAAAPDGENQRTIKLRKLRWAQAPRLSFAEMDPGDSVSIPDFVADRHGVTTKVNLRRQAIQVRTRLLRHQRGYIQRDSRPLELVP